MSDTKQNSTEYKDSLYMVSNLLNDFSIVDSNNQKATLRMSQFGFFGVLPVFITKKGAEDYCKENNINYNQIFKLQ